MVFIGIDPGLRGAIAVLGASGAVISVTDTPLIAPSQKKPSYDIQEMKNLLLLALWDQEGCTVGIESIHAMPKQGVSSMFKMGRGLGLWEGLVVGLGYPYSMITPQRWKKEMLDGMGDKSKVSSIIVAKRLFPDQHILKSKDGRAEALLIAEYIRRHMYHS